MAERSLKDRDTTRPRPAVVSFSASPTVGISKLSGDAPNHLSADDSVFPTLFNRGGTRSYRSEATQPISFPLARSNHSLPTIPCFSGEQPVSSDAWPAAVTVWA